MQNINLLSHLFNEELHLMSSHFFDTKTYLEYLKPHHSDINTHFSIHLKKNAAGAISSESHIETPFHHKSMHACKSGYINLLKIDSHKYVMDYIKNVFKEKQVSFKSAFMKCLYTDNREDTLKHIKIELFVGLPIDKISDETLSYYYYHKLMEHIRKQILSEIQNLYFDQQKTENERTILIRKYQNKISYYLSYLESNFPHIFKNSNVETIAIQKTLEDSFKCIYLNLEKTINYMENCLYDYMDKEQPTSYLQRKTFINHHYTEAKELITLVEKSKLPKDIEMAICKPLVSIVSNNIRKLSYQRRDYCTTYISIFGALLKKTASSDHDAIYKLLIALNYNNHDIFKTLEREFLIEIEKLNSIVDKKNYLYTKLAKINRIAITSLCKYHYELPGLKELLLEFVNEMLKLLEQQELLADQEIVPLENIKNKIKANVVVKRKVNTSAHELALLARLFYECGVTQLENGKHKYFKFLASHYATKDGIAISEHNIKNAFYSPKQNNFESVEKLLINMLSKLQKLKNNSLYKKVYS